MKRNIQKSFNIYNEIKILRNYFKHIDKRTDLRWLKTDSSTFQDVDFDGS